MLSEKSLPEVSPENIRLWQRVQFRRVWSWRKCKFVVVKEYPSWCLQVKDSDDIWHDVPAVEAIYGEQNVK